MKEAGIPGKRSLLKNLILRNSILSDQQGSQRESSSQSSVVIPKCDSQIDNEHSNSFTSSIVTESLTDEDDDEIQVPNLFKDAQNCNNENIKN